MPWWAWFLVGLYAVWVVVGSAILWFGQLDVADRPSLAHVVALVAVPPLALPVSAVSGFRARGFRTKQRGWRTLEPEWQALLDQIAPAVWPFGIGDSREEGGPDLLRKIYWGPICDHDPVWVFAAEGLEQDAVRLSEALIHRLAINDKVSVTYEPPGESGWAYGKVHFAPTDPSSQPGTAASV